MNKQESLEEVRVIKRTELYNSILVCANCHREIHYPHNNRENI